MFDFGPCLATYLVNAISDGQKQLKAGGRKK